MRNSKELILQAFEGTRPSRTPIFDLFCNDAVVEYFAQAKLDGTDDWAVVRAAARNGLDATREIAMPMPEGTSSTDAFGNVNVSYRWTSWVEKHAFSDVEGWAGWMKEYVDRFEEGPSRFIPLAFTEGDVSEERKKVVFQEQLKANEPLGETMELNCRACTAINTLLVSIGLELFSYLWMDHKDLVLQWMRTYLKATLNYIEVTANPETCPVGIIYSDVAYKNGPMFSDSTFAEIGFYEEVEQIVAACHRKGIKIVFHSDGNIMSMLDDLVATGIDGLNPIEKAAGMDIYEIRRRFPELTIVGGVDVTELMRVATPDEVRSETRKIIDEVGSEGRLLIGSSTEVSDDIPLVNYQTFCDEVMKG